MRSPRPSPAPLLQPEGRRVASSNSPASTYLAGINASGGSPSSAYLTETTSMPTKKTARSRETSASAAFFVAPACGGSAPRSVNLVAGSGSCVACVQIACGQYYRRGAPAASVASAFRA